MASPETFLLVSGDFVRTGGMDMGNYFFADFLARKGCEVHIVSHNVDPALSAFPEVTWHRVVRPYHSTILGEPMLRFVGRRVCRQIKRRKPSTRSLVNGGNCPLPDINWVHYLHAATVPMPGSNIANRLKTKAAHREFLRLEAIALRQARVIIANSKRTKADIIRCYGISESLIHVVYYGAAPGEFDQVDTAERESTRRALGLSLEKRIILFIGAMGDRRKGFDTLFNAWELIGASGRKRAQLLVIGTGAELPMWRARAVRAGYEDSIVFLGFRRDVPAIVRASDGLVAPVRYEAFGLAVLEALCCGLPALVSQDAGVAERYPREMNDLLISDPNNATEVAQKLTSLITQNDSWREKILPLAKALRSYTWQDMNHRIYQVINEN